MEYRTFDILLQVSVEFDSNMYICKFYPSLHWKSMIQIILIIDCCVRKYEKFKIWDCYKSFPKMSFFICLFTLWIQSFYVTSFVRVWDKLHNSHFLQFSSIRNVIKQRSFHTAKHVQCHIVMTSHFLLHCLFLNCFILKYQQCEFFIPLLDLLSHQSSRLTAAGHTQRRSRRGIHWSSKLHQISKCSYSTRIALVLLPRPFFDSRKADSHHLLQQIRYGSVHSVAVYLC